MILYSSIFLLLWASNNNLVANGFTATVTRKPFHHQTNTLGNLSPQTTTTTTTTTTTIGTATTTTARRHTKLNSSSNSNSSRDVASTLISNLSIAALKLRLAAQTSVECNVQASNLLQGQVGPVTVKGKGWQSPRGLTCRAIETTIQTCQVDGARILREQRIFLTTPATGKALIAFDGRDFGNFLVHHLMKDLISKENILFLKDDVVIDTAKNSVEFFATHANQRWQCSLQPSSNGAVVTVTGDDDMLALELTDTLTTFFNELVFELDGTFLSFQNMQTIQKKSSDIVMLALSILVKKFPSPGLSF